MASKLALYKQFFALAKFLPQNEGREVEMEICASHGACSKTPTFLCGKLFRVRNSIQSACSYGEGLWLSSRAFALHLGGRVPAGKSKKDTYGRHSHHTFKATQCHFKQSWLPHEGF